MRLYGLLVIAGLLGGCNSDKGSGGGGPDMSVPGSCMPACTAANTTCDPGDNKCKLDGTTTKVGGACMTSGADSACGTAANATCNNQTQDGFPGGYCSYEPCSTVELCPIGATCAHLGGESNACFKICTSDADCRTPDYGCFNIDPLYTSGAGHKVCFLKNFACTTSADCPAIKPLCKNADIDAGISGVCST